MFQTQDMFQQLAEIDKDLLNDLTEIVRPKMSFDFSEEETFLVETRLNRINRLRRQKYGNSIEEIFKNIDKKRRRLMKTAGL